jgi:energy-coupling factor transport system substrate-specific component
MEKAKWTLPQVVFLALLAFLFGAVFMGAGVLYALLVSVLTPFGLTPFANEILFGMWTIAAPVAGMLIPKMGSAVLGEVFAALAEMLYGSYFGAGVLLSGFIQGLGTEVGFLVTGYKRYDSVTLLYGAIGTTVFSFVYEFFKFGYGTYGFGMVAALFLVRFASVCFFGIFLTKQIVTLFHKAQGVRVSH